MATIEYTPAVHDDGPPKVSDAFVLELRTNAARVPAIPVRPLTAREVAVAVRYAQDEGGQYLPIDLSAMKRIVVDPAEKTARVQPGVTPAELEQATFSWGLAPLLDRNGIDRSGFVLANLLAARVVTPDGDLVEADADVLRAIRTGRFGGIVVDATYRLHSAAELRR
jgi:FAD/FMN-containing dehydrogenase